MRRARWLLLLTGLLSACSPAGILDALTPGYGVTRTTARYADGPRGELDVYRPATGGPWPIIVFLYGGNWQTGDRGMYGFVGRPLAARGAVVVVPDYRLAPAVAFPAFVEDNAAAVAWAIGHAAELGGDPGRVFVIGHSAGAYNAAMLALDPRYLAAAGTSRAALAGVVGLAGPYDFLPITQPDLLPIFAPAGDGPASQPITYADGTNPPLLLLAGSEDTTVLPRNTESLAARVREKGGPVEAKICPGVGHIGLLTAITPLFRGRAPVLEDVWAFISSHRSSNRNAAAPPPRT